MNAEAAATFNPESTPVNGKPRTKAESHIGEKYGRLLISGLCDPIKNEDRVAICLCDCGKEQRTRLAPILAGRVKSCGCLSRELTIDRNISTAKHGMWKSVEFKTWGSMLARCYNANTQKFHLYGGRGITVCDRWRTSFSEFFKDVGMRPSSKHSLDRFPNKDGNYEPENCRWATDEEQNRNRSVNVNVTFNGETMCASEWDAQLGFGHGVTSMRIGRGWTVERALTQKPRRSPSPKVVS